MSVRTVTLADAKINLSKLTELARQGETIIITRHGKPVAKISQTEVQRTPVDLQSLRALTNRMPPQTESAGEFLRRLRDDDRY